MSFNRSERLIQPEDEKKVVFDALASCLDHKSRSVFPHYAPVSVEFHETNEQSSEGAEFDSTSNTIRHFREVVKRPDGSWAMYITDQTMPMRGTTMYSVPLHEMFKMTQSKEPFDQPYMLELLSAHVHELAHGLTMNILWKDTPLDQTIHHEKIVAAIQHDTVLAQQASAFSLSAFIDFIQELHGDLFYQRSYEKRIQLLRLLLPALPPSERAEYVHKGLMFGFGEMISSYVQRSVLQIRLPLVEQYAGYTYAVKGLQYVLPTPSQRVEVANHLRGLTLPLEDDLLRYMQSLSNPTLLVDYVNESNLNDIVPLRSFLQRY